MWGGLWALWFLALPALLPPPVAAEPVYTVLYNGESESTARFIDDLAHLWRASNAVESSSLSGRREASAPARLQALRRGRAQFALVDADALARNKAAYPDLAALALLWPESLHVLARGAPGAPLAALPGGDLLVEGAALYAQAALAEARGPEPTPVRWLLLPGGGLPAALQRKPLPLLLASSVAPLPEIAQALRESPDLQLLSLARPLIDQARGGSPWLTPVTLPPGTYPGQNRPVETLAIHQVLVTRADTAPGLVVQAIIALSRWRERMAAASPLFAVLDRKANVPAVAWFPFHVAAMKELGLATPERTTP